MSFLKKDQVGIYNHARGYTVETTGLEARAGATKEQNLARRAPGILAGQGNV